MESLWFVEFLAQIDANSLKYLQENKYADHLCNLQLSMLFYLPSFD